MGVSLTTGFFVQWVLDLGGGVGIGLVFELGVRGFAGVFSYWMAESGSVKLSCFFWAGAWRGVGVLCCVFLRFFAAGGADNLFLFLFLFF